MMLARLPQGLALVLLFMLLVIVSLAARPLFPVDETRYVSVAWEMLSNDSWLVPHLNGEPYSHKPPLMFWLFMIGWRLFGISEWWPRLVPTLFIAGGMFLTWRMARRLWPGEGVAASLAPWILLGASLWVYCSVTIMFDNLIVFFAILGLLGVLRAASGRARSGWLVMALAIALGMLAKGPVIILHILPAAILAPWWRGESGPARWPAWYAGLLTAIGSGTALALCWALPAALAGGEEYGKAIIWHQTSGRIFTAFAHARPWWWYLRLLPALLYPWSIWPPLWSALATVLRRPLDGGIRFCLSWLLPTLVMLSLVSGKQPQYMLSLLPPFALLSARALAATPLNGRRIHRLPVGLSFFLLGVLMLVVALFAPFPELPPWTTDIPAWAGLVLLSAGLLLPLLRIRSAAHEVHILAVSTIFLVLVLTLGLVIPAVPTQDIRDVGRLVHRLQQDGRTVAHACNYEGQYHFAGRLEKPLLVIDRERTTEWAAANPGGAVIVYIRDWAPSGRVSPLLVRPYRGQYVTVWSSEAAIHLPIPARKPSRETGGS
jgi:4-amino-4-deoxy-L-arabinose transferase-like glycosyltransferase